MLFFLSECKSAELSLSASEFYVVYWLIIIFSISKYKCLCWFRWISDFSLSWSGEGHSCAAACYTNKLSVGSPGFWEGIRFRPTKGFTVLKQGQCERPSLPLNVEVFYWFHSLYFIPTSLNFSLWERLLKGNSEAGPLHKLHNREELLINEPNVFWDFGVFLLCRT